MITENQKSLKNLINSGNLNSTADQARVLALGDMYRALPTFLRKKAAVADTGSLATLLALVLPEDAKACTVTRATVRAGAVSGELAVVAYGTTPATGQIAVGPNGDIVTLAADAITSVDVVYQPEKYDVAEVTLSAAANVLTLPAAFAAQGVIFLLEVVATTGGATGKKVVLIPGAGAPAAGQARLNLAKTTVTFAGADAVTAATVKFAVVAAVDVDALLTATSAIA